MEVHFGCEELFVAQIARVEEDFRLYFINAAVGSGEAQEGQCQSLGNQESLDNLWLPVASQATEAKS